MQTDLYARIECRCVAIDLRGHGLSSCINEDDLSTERQIRYFTIHFLPVIFQKKNRFRDISAIISSLFPISAGDDSVPMIVVGELTYFPYFIRIYQLKKCTICHF